MSISVRDRQPKGTSEGGRFVEEVNPEPTIDLLAVGEAVSCDEISGRPKFVNDVWQMEW